MPASYSRTVEEWRKRDEEFMASMCVGVSAAQGERAHMEDAHRIVHQFDSLIRRAATAAAAAAAPAPAGGQTAAAASANVSATAGVAAAPASSGTTPPAAASVAVAPPSLPTLLSQLGTQSFFGVYDGHGGREAADYISDHLHLNVAKRMAQRVLSVSTGAAGPGTSSPNGGTTTREFDLGDAMKLGAADTEVALLAESLERQSQAGAVVAFTIFAGMQLYVAHAGDCLLFGTRVALADGKSSCPVEHVTPGMQLVGPAGRPVTVTQALAGRASSTIRLSYGGRNVDATSSASSCPPSSHTVTRNHLVTLRWMKNPFVHIQAPAAGVHGYSTVEAAWCDRSVCSTQQMTRAHSIRPAVSNV
jgi:hypothetical protein